MKKLFFMMMLFFGLSVNAEAFEMTATLTADNVFALYVGNESGVSFVGSGNRWEQSRTSPLMRIRKIICMSRHGATGLWRRG